MPGHQMLRNDNKPVHPSGFPPTKLKPRAQQTEPRRTRHAGGNFGHRKPMRLACLVEPAQAVQGLLGKDLFPPFKHEAEARNWRLLTGMLGPQSKRV